MPKDLGEDLEEKEKTVNDLFNFFSKLTPSHTFILFISIIIFIFIISCIILFKYPDLVKEAGASLISAVIGGGLGGYIGTKRAQN
ncbi:MAG: hypothetical protein Q7U60_13095 [Candidatus Methanoperedens sp.]|nr:hypothetical protein [Candidatus Methanoperedens sp.]